MTAQCYPKNQKKIGYGNLLVSRCSSVSLLFSLGDIVGGEASGYFIKTNFICPLSGAFTSHHIFIIFYKKLSKGKIIRYLSARRNETSQKTRGPGAPIEKRNFTAYCILGLIPSLASAVFEAWPVIVALILHITWPLCVMTCTFLDTELESTSLQLHAYLHCRIIPYYTSPRFGISH